MTRRFFIVCVCFAHLLLSSVLRASLDIKPETKINEYFVELDRFFVTHHLVKKNEARLKQLVFEFKEKTSNSKPVIPYINIMEIEGIFIVKIFDIPVVDNQLSLSLEVEKTLVRAYLFSEALTNENNDKTLWGKDVNHELGIPDIIITGLLSLKSINHLDTKASAMNHYRFQQKQTKLQELKLDFSDQYNGSNTRAFTLTSLSFIGTWKAWLFKTGKHPNWNEIIKFRGDWKNYFKNQLPNSQKWMDTESQWLEFSLLNLLKRQPYDKLTLSQSKQEFEKLWENSASLWLEIGEPMTDKDFKVISYLKKEISTLMPIINPYYYPLIGDFKNLLVQKWFKSPGIKGQETAEAQNLNKLGLGKDQQKKVDTEIEKNKNATEDERRDQLIKLYDEFKQKLAQTNLKSQLMIEFITKEAIKNDFVDAEEKKAFNKSLNLYKKDPVSYYLNQYN